MDGHVVTHADVGAFLVRLLRLDKGAVVRLRPVSPTGVVELWAMLPFEVLATRRVSYEVPEDTTVAAAELLAALEDPSRVPRRRDEAWRWALPPGRGEAVEQIPALELTRVAAAASRTLRQATQEGVGGRAVGERMLRDALLDHVAIAVTGTDGQRVDIPQRVIQAAVRMGFLGRVTYGSEATDSDASTTDHVTVRLAMAWIGVDASYGSVWYRPSYPLRFR